MTIDWIRERVGSGTYLFSQHGDEERANDGLTIADVRQALLSGRVLEEYADTGRGESCLVVGFSDSGIPVHVVCGGRSDRLVVVTVYVPKPPRFKRPYERGVPSDA
jgi:hypothetical protein